MKNPAEDHFRNEITAGKKSGKFVVVAGCVPQGDQKSSFIQNLSVIGVQQIDRVIEVVEETLKGLFNNIYFFEAIFLLIFCRTYYSIVGTKENKWKKRWWC